jgi:hypothetical protein
MKKFVFVIFLSLLISYNFKGQDTAYIDPKIVYADNTDYWRIWRHYGLEKIKLDKNRTLFEYANYFKGKRYVDDELTKLYIVSESSVFIQSKRNSVTWNYKKISQTLFQIRQKNFVGYSNTLVPINKTGTFSFFSNEGDLLFEVQYKNDDYFKLLPGNKNPGFKIYNADSVDKKASYPGGLSAMQTEFNNYMLTNIPVLENMIEGTIICHVIIDEKGYLHISKVIRSPGNYLEEYSIYAISQLKRFIPAEKNNKKVAMETILNFKIVLE